MSYLLPATTGGNYSGGEMYAWFSKSLYAAGVGKDPMVSIVDSIGGPAFKKTYGVRVVRLSSSDGEVSRVFVEFPTESEATLFLLRWS